MTTANPFSSHPPTAPASALDRSDSDVLIVDDVPDNLAVLHDALDESGYTCLLYTSPSPRDVEESRMPSSA